MTAYILAIDQGTTSSRAIVFDRDHRPVAIAQREFPQHFPASGWVEHDPEDIWRSVLDSAREAIAKVETKTGAADIQAIGITNQRETTVIWDRETGAAIHPAIVWQDRRTADLCDTLKDAGHEAVVRHKTGLLLDPYFSATKIAWILDAVPGARARAQKGELAFGTIDSFVLWRLTGGAVHATDETNAARTLLYHIHDHCWDDDLLDLFNVPRAILPEVRDSDDDFGVTAAALFGRAIAIRGIAGDQHAASIGQACFQPGMMKSTYGTGCFALLNTGAEAVLSQNRLLTTVAYRIGGRTTYALEGSIFIAGAAVQWLRDGLGIIENAADTDRMARDGDPLQDVYLVPAFTGLGAPYWDAHARGAMFGLTRATGPKEFARAALEAVCYQTRDLLEAMRRDWPRSEGAATALRVDGGMVANDWTMQCLADILNATVDRPHTLETTALGAAYLAGKAIGLYPDMESFAASMRFEKRFTPEMDAAVRERKYQGWRRAVARTLSGGRDTPPTPQAG
ncbi:glycerol kinase GlpK [Varunaivibrio sulfuroxidans]|uniref:Glycerol kinase n=1 Tax=Varunaivibrio sulfuroxidans TaxID=1773489 RepID=A0A4R3JDZ4_9PROT|nr:glycerol kinase GlpK [Varunaivibrio sulfuroxidans]TCS63994.1 glycerol kinase [Varunaivibrio sulfuroxidans]WES31553.1 glycerol kinase GlpK [Varunaivibrio sulfuroxidans]